MRKAVVLVLAAACLMLGVSCNSTAEEADAQTVAARLRLPQQIVGLQVAPEKVGSGLKKIERPYVDTVAVFSLRENELLRASLQLNRFNRAARPKDPDFRASIVSTIGGSAPVDLRVGDKEVSATTAADQTVFVWFDGNAMVVLAVQKDFEFPRTLLRHAVDLDLSL